MSAAGDTITILGFLVELIRLGIDALRSPDPSKLRKITDILPPGSISKTEAELLRQRASLSDD